MRIWRPSISAGSIGLQLHAEILVEAIRIDPLHEQRAASRPPDPVATGEREFLMCTARLSHAPHMLHRFLNGSMRGIHRASSTSTYPLPHLGIESARGIPRTASSCAAVRPGATPLR